MTAQPERLRVMLSVDAPTPGATQFVDHLVEGAADGVEFVFFEWKRALQAEYDVFHLHWPERIARRGVMRTVALLTALRFRRIPLVRTLHNVQPHEPGGRVETLLLALIDRSTVLYIGLNDVTVPPTRADRVTIPHPHYLDRIGDDDRTPIPGRALYFGSIRPYKGIDALLTAFDQVESRDLSLRIVGEARGTRGDGVRSAEAVDARISSRLEFVTDDDLMREIRESELVVLPHRDMHNSGSTFLGLSLARPVLVPRNAVNEALAAEVGAGWVHLYDGVLTGAAISDAFASARSEQRQPPRLERRGWAELGLQHQAAYRQALMASRPRVGRR